MDFNKNLAKELLNTLNGDTWYSSNFEIIIQDVTADIAVKKLKGFPNSIAEIVVHMTQWKLFCIEKIKGNTDFDITLNSEEDWKRFNSLGEDEWEYIKSEFGRASIDLAKVIEQTPDSGDDKIVPGRKYSFFHLFVGILEHEVVHMTQVSYLKKLLLV
ncbi:MAG: hypothetical protein QM764_04225 [Chitinophagaceae bacterium]